METLKLTSAFNFCAVSISPLALIFLQLLALFLVASMMDPDFRLWLLDVMETEINVFTFFFGLSYYVSALVTMHGTGNAVIECAVQSLLFVA